MRNLVNRLMSSVVYAPDDGAGSGGAPAGGAGAGGDGSASSGDAGAAAAAAASAQGGAGADGGAAELSRFDGLPDNAYGKTDKETLENAAKMLKGYRDRDAAQNIPDKPEAYAQFGADVPAEIKPHLETLTADPLFSRMSAFAAEQRVPLPVFQGLVRQFIASSAEMGLLEPPIDVAAERAALTPDSAKHLTPAEQSQARERRMNDNFAFVDQLTTKGLPKETADFAKMMLGDTAKGHQLFEFMRAQMSGGNAPFMAGGNGAGNDPRAELARRAALPENTWGDPKFDKASYDRLQADYQRVIPND